MYPCVDFGLRHFGLVKNFFPLLLNDRPVVIHLLSIFLDKEFQRVILLPVLRIDLLDLGLFAQNLAL